MNALGRHRERHRQRRERFAAAPLGGLELDAGRRRILLHLQVHRAASRRPDSDRSRRHTRACRHHRGGSSSPARAAPACPAACCSSAADWQTSAPPGSPRSAASRCRRRSAAAAGSSTPGAPRSMRSNRHGDRPIPHRMHAVAAQVQLARGLGRCREDRRIPPDEVLSQTASELGDAAAPRGVELPEALAIGRIGAHEPRCGAERAHVRDRIALEAHQRGDAGALGIGRATARCARASMSVPRITLATEASARARAASRSRCHSGASWPFQPRKPKYSRCKPGARSAAISAASITSVPEPHIGSSNSAPRAAASFQRARSKTPAARFSRSGASPASRR